MRRFAVLAAALALIAGACGDGPETGRARWTGSWTLDRERTARSFVEFGKAELAAMARQIESTVPQGRNSGQPPPKAPPPPPDEVMLKQARVSAGLASADVSLGADGSARADLLGYKYVGTWSEVGDEAEMKIVSRLDGVLQGQDGVSIRFRRDGEFLVVGGDTDAQGNPKPQLEMNTVVPRRRMYLSRK